MDIASHDLNLQMQQRRAEYKKTGDESFMIDAEYIKYEFETWLSTDEAMFVPPAEI